MFIYNPNLAEHKTVRGAIDTKEQFNITVKSDAKWCNLLIKKDGGDYKVYSMARKLPRGDFFVCLQGLESGLYFYHFLADSFVYGEGYDLNARLQPYVGYKDYQLTVYDHGYATPDLLKGGLIYQIFPDRFCRAGDATCEGNKVFRKDWGGTPTYRSPNGMVLNNEFFGGDFKGISSKLDYLKDLGVTVIYLNPISKAYSSHRYDTGDYLTPDPLLGTVDDLKALIKKADSCGISFVFDGVYNHTGADSLYFNRYGNYPEKGAYNTVSSPFYSWYDFRDHPYSYLSWWNFDSLPSIKKDSVDYQSFITEKVLPFYFDMGFKGVRLDVVDELSSAFVEAIRRVAQKYGAAVIGEVWEDATNKFAYGERKKYFLGKQLDSVMNYPLKDGICDYLLHKDSTYLVHVLSSQINNFPKCALDSIMNVLSTHDTVRILNVLGRKRVETNKDLLKDLVFTDEEYFKGRALLKIAYGILYTVYGTPSLYYGDEAGLTGDLDPYNRRCFPWGREDLDILDFIKKLGLIRSSCKAFKTGDLNLLYYDKKILVFERLAGSDQIIVAVSMSDTAVNLRFSSPVSELLTESSPSALQKLAVNSIGIYRGKNAKVGL